MNPVPSESAAALPLARVPMDKLLPFERSIADLEARLAAAESEAERVGLQRDLDAERAAVFSNLTPWQRVQLARHPLRPRMRAYVDRIFEDFEEVAGDRASGDDPAMVGGIARFDGKTVMVVGQEKGGTTEEKVYRNFGMAHPWGYRKALRLFETAERLRLPVITFVDTPAAHPGVEAEAGGQGPAIAANLLAMASLRTPLFAAVIGEGGSGGALGIAMGDHIAMFEHAIYVICPPERCAEILWRDAEKKDLAAAALRITAAELAELGVIDAVLPEPAGGAHRDFTGAATVLAGAIGAFLDQAANGGWDLARRQERFARIGQWVEADT